MNHNYPVNPSPFTQHHSTSTSTYPATPPMNGTPAQYYPMHPTAYPPAPHGYAPYPQYPQQMMMYGPPRPNTSLPEQQQQQQPQPIVNAPSPAQMSPTTTTTTGKRKRRTDATRPRDRESDHEGPSNESISKHTPPIASSATPIDTKKRTKTQRACDSCRSRKIRLAQCVSRRIYPA